MRRSSDLSGYATGDRPIGRRRTVVASEPDPVDTADATIGLILLTAL
ncbi:hypothetical protein C7S15_7553 [Burkholderia cepacia]|nr:hypothetical protein [Burkholderia cepacia]